MVGGRLFQVLSTLHSMLKWWAFIQSKLRDGDKSYNMQFKCLPYFLGLMSSAGVIFTDWTSVTPSRHNLTLFCGFRLDLNLSCTSESIKFHSSCWQRGEKLPKIRQNIWMGRNNEGEKFLTQLFNLSFRLPWSILYTENFTSAIMPYWRRQALTSHTSNPFRMFHCQFFFSALSSF